MPEFKGLTTRKDPFEIQATTGDTSTALLNFKDSSGNVVATIDNAGSLSKVDSNNLYYPAGTYTVTSEVALPQSIRGDGMYRTILRAGSGISFAWMFRKSSTTNVNGIEISDLTFDLNNVTAAAGLSAQYVTDMSIRRCRFVNIPANGWGVRIGVESGADTTIRNKRILFEDCLFDTHAGTLEQVLLLNSEDVIFRNCWFRDNTSAQGFSIGLYQLLDNVLIDGCTFEPGTGGGIYSSLSTNNIKIRGSHFEGGGGHITGANGSDNGTFGYTYIDNFHIDDCTFTQGGVQVMVGAMRGAKITNCTFEKAVDNALVVFGGNSGLNTAVDGLDILGNTFRDNNTGNSFHVLHPAILFGGVGGTQNVNITDNRFYDTQATKTQRHAIIFDGALTWSGINIANNRIWADAANGGVSIGATSGAAFGSNVRLSDTRDLTGALPNGMLIDESGTGSPESVWAGAVGSQFRRTDNANSLYVKQTGTGNTGWVLK